MNTKILIVDDNAQNISLMKLLLQHAGYTVISASNGADGVKLAKQEHPDLILMDIQMPEVSGIEAAREILADVSTLNIPIIGVSAYARPELRQQALRLGMVGFFEKPIHNETFIKEIRKFLP